MVDSYCGIIPVVLGEKEIGSRKGQNKVLLQNSGRESGGRWEWGRRNLRPRTDWQGLQKETQSDLVMVWIRKWGTGRLRTTPSFQPLGIRLVMMPFTEMEKIGGRTGLGEALILF